MIFNILLVIIIMKLQQTNVHSQNYTLPSILYQPSQAEQPYPNPKYKQKQNHQIEPGYITGYRQTQPASKLQAVQSSKQELILTEETYKQHRQFLQRYKKERQIQKQKKILKQEQNESSSGEQQRKVEMKKKRYTSNVHISQNHEDHQIKQYSKEYVVSKLQSIINKIKEEIIQADDSRIRYKIFTDSMQSKNDIQRVAKEKRFIRAQHSKEYTYQEPTMPSINKLPVNFRIKTQSVYNESQLGKKARNFITRIQNDQQNLLGKHLLRKKLQSNKKEQEQREQIHKMVSLNEMKRQERKNKAEMNMLYLKEKMKISQMNLYSNIEAINISKHVAPRIHQQILESRKSRFEEQAAKKHRYRKESNQVDDPVPFSIKSKIAIRKRKNIRPTEYHNVTQFDEQQHQTTISNRYINKNNQDNVFKEIPLDKQERLKRELQDVEQQLRKYEEEDQLRRSVQNNQWNQDEEYGNEHYANIEDTQINVQLTKNQSKQINFVLHHKRNPSSSIQ